MRMSLPTRMMQTSPVLSANAPLPIRATLEAVVRLLKLEWKNMLRLLVFPLAILTLCAIFFPAKTPTIGDEHLSTPDVTPGDVIKMVVMIIAQVYMYFTALRYFILGDGPADWKPQWHPAMVSYLLKALLIGLLLCLPAIVIGLAVMFFANQWLLITGLVVAYFLALSVVFTRVSLSMTAAAVGGDSRIITAWQRTEGQIVRIMTLRFLSGLMVLVPVIAVVVVAAIVGGLAPMLGSGVSMAGSTLFSVLIAQATEAVIYNHFYDAPEAHGNSMSSGDAIV